MNKFLLLTDNTTYRAQLKDCLQSISPKALILECAADELDIYSSSFEDPGCIVFFDSSVSEIKEKAASAHCLLIGLVTENELPATKVDGLLYTHIKVENQLANLKAFLNLSLFRRETHKIEGIESVLSTLSEKMGQELKRVKSLHEKLVNFRSEDYKGVKVTSKFASGEKSGGEFFDVVNTKKGAIFILSSTPSYVASSIIMSQVECLYQEKSASGEILAKLMSNLEKEFLSLGLNLSECSFLVMQLELATMKIETFSFGGVKFYVDGQECLSSPKLQLPLTDISPYQGELRLERANRFVILSPGLIKGMDKKLAQEVTSLMDEGGREFLTKTFFELKKNRNNSFLEYDASAIYFEVDKNAILQV